MAVVFDLVIWPVHRGYDGRSSASVDDVELIDLFDDPFLVMLPVGHPLADKAELGLDDLRGERITGSSNDCAMGDRAPAALW